MGGGVGLTTGSAVVTAGRGLPKVMAAISTAGEEGESQNTRKGERGIW